MPEKSLTKLDIQALEWHIQSLHRRYKSVEQTRIKVTDTYKHMSPRFHQEVDRIFEEMLAQGKEKSHDT